MKLIVKRKHFRDEYTIGKMYIDYNKNISPEYFCDTLEDKVRLDGQKIYGKTAIPAGTYRLLMTFSPKFNRIMPLINNVPGFTGVRIHSGNIPEHTEGCLLVGENKQVGKVINSQVTFLKLFNILKTYPEIDTIQIINEL